MEDLHGLLATLVARLDGLDPKALSGLAELPRIRRALVEMSEHQADLLELTELGGQPGDKPEDGEPAADGDDDPEFIFDDIPDEERGDEPLEGELVPQGAEPPGTTT